MGMALITFVWEVRIPTITITNMVYKGHCGLSLNNFQYLPYGCPLICPGLWAKFWPLKPLMTLNPNSRNIDYKGRKARPGKLGTFSVLHMYLINPRPKAGDCYEKFIYGIVRIMRVRGGRFPVVCLSVAQLLPTALIIRAKIFRACCGAYL